MRRDDDFGRRPRVVLTIAGSDSGGGAGIQADLKTFAALGVYGATALTAVTAQNTVEVRSALELPLEIVDAQIDAVFDDLGVDAVKTGMLSSAATIEHVVEKLNERGAEKLVVDPVMVAKSGDRLLREDAVATLSRRLIPIATVVTPNLPEAGILVGFPVTGIGEMRRAAEALVAMGAGAAVVKGGHGEGDEAVDVVFHDGHHRELRTPRIPSRDTHGTGCTFSAAIAAQLALGQTVEEAVELAKAYLTAALHQGVRIGSGHGPVDHFAECTLWHEARGRASGSSDDRGSRC